MIDGRRIITAIIGVFVATVSIYADMTPVYQLCTGCGQPSNVCRRTNFQCQFTHLSNPSNYPGVAGSDFWSVEF